MKAIATFQTEHANRYLATLCKHFSHKVAVTYDDQGGHVDFPFGQCGLMAESGHLTLTATASDAAHLDTVTEVITRHLERFAFRENPRIDWQRCTT